MNERIRELAGQALDKVVPYTWTTLDYDEIQKLQDYFAELIVRECIQTLLNNTPEEFTNEAAEEDWDRGYDQAMKDCVHHIQEHFGIDGCE